jgi:RNA polymerase sigma-70 factor, ECF subfamily
MEPANPKTRDNEAADERFLRLFVTHEAALRSYARAIVPTWDAVDEVIQEASLVIWRKLDQLETPEGFLPWAKVIVRFEALRARRNFARDRLVFSEELMTLLGETTVEPDADELVREKAALRLCLTKLSPAHRELLLAPYDGSGKIKQLAEQSPRTLNSIYKLIGRLRAKLQLCAERELANAARSALGRMNPLNP